jgi:hypothetical protein
MKRSRPYRGIWSFLQMMESRESWKRLFALIGGGYKNEEAFLFLLLAIVS